MDLSQALVSPVVASSVAGIVALCGALGSQIINARTTLKTKRLEMEYGKKSQLYQLYLVEAARFANDPKGVEKHRPYLEAYMSVRLVASPSVLPLLGDVNAQITEIYRHQSSITSKGENIVTGPFCEAIEKLQEEMRKELHALTR